MHWISRRQGIENIFSIVVRLRGIEEICHTTEAELEALVDPMSGKLSKSRERFFVTSGEIIVAECIGK